MDPAKTVLDKKNRLIYVSREKEQALQSISYFPSQAEKFRFVGSRLK